MKPEKEMQKFCELAADLIASYQKLVTASDLLADHTGVDRNQHLLSTFPDVYSVNDQRDTKRIIKHLRQLERQLPEFYKARYQREQATRLQRKTIKRLNLTPEEQKILGIK
jgi:hypothetical protein